MLEWDENERHSIICVVLNSNLLCLFSAFSLPPSLFNEKSDDCKSIKYFHNLALQFDKGGAGKKGKVTLKTTRSESCTKVNGPKANLVEGVYRISEL